MSTVVHFMGRPGHVFLSTTLDAIPAVGQSLEFERDPSKDYYWTYKVTKVVWKIPSQNARPVVEIYFESDRSIKV